MTVRCMCLDDSNKPKEIPNHLWVSKMQEYHITFVYWHPRQGVQGVDLLEIALDESCDPYETYQLRRFGIHKDDVEKFYELVQLCNDLDDVDVEQLMKETELQIAD